MNHRMKMLAAITFAATGVQSAWADIQAACTKANDEAPLVWYTVALSDRNDATVAAFTKRYPGIKLRIQGLTSGQAGTRYASERAAGVVGADIMAIADDSFIAAARKSGWVEEIQKTELPNLAKLNDKFFAGGVATVTILPMGIVYNKGLVGSKPLQSWQDVLRPEFKGKIVLGDPRTVPPNVALFKMLTKEYGDDFLPKLADQKPAVLTSITTGVQQVAAGEKVLAFPAVEGSAASLRAAGADVAFLAVGPTTGYEFNAFVSKGARSPNAARCLLNFLFSPEGQAAYVGKQGVSPVGAPDTATMPNGYASPDLTKLSAADKTSVLQALKLQ